MNKPLFKLFFILLSFSPFAFSSQNGNAFLFSARGQITKQLNDKTTVLEKNIIFDPSSCKISTGGNSFACIILSNLVSIIIEENTQIKIKEFNQEDFYGTLNIHSDEPSKTTLEIELLKGSIFIDKQKSYQGSSFILSTENLGLVKIYQAKQNIAFSVNQEQNKFKIYGFKQNKKGANFQYFTDKDNPTRNIVTEYQDIEIRWLVTKESFAKKEPVSQEASSMEFRNLEEFSFLGNHSKERIFFSDKNTFKITIPRSWIKQRSSDSHLIK